jgi:hypothetical protein
MKLFLITILVLLAGAKGQESADNEQTSSCVQNKLELPVPVPLRHFQKGSKLEKYFYAYQLVKFLCDDDYREQAIATFNRLLKPYEELTLNCYRLHLINSNVGGPLVDHLDKNVNFDNSNECPNILLNFKNYIRVNSHSSQSDEDLKCVDTIIDAFIIMRIRGILVQRGGYSKDIVDTEKEVFINTLNELTNKLVDCFVNNIQ